jgi:hypothetical protein
VTQFTSPRAWAFALLGIHEYELTRNSSQKARAIRELLNEKLLNLWKLCSEPDWPWFESHVTYENARMCQALIVTGAAIPDSRSLEIGLSSLAWLCDQHRKGLGWMRLAVPLIGFLAPTNLESRCTMPHPAVVATGCTATVPTKTKARNPRSRS